ncbi:MAG: SDR family NAD(P)-dependent oxidoreductase [Anaerolineae bacterium]|nr:SDR family NAD(P)-dependent oxidoreductase [Anaerolineae bacterium]
MRLGRRLMWSGVLGGALYWLARYLRPKHSTLVLNDKVVVITGASSGIGRALAFAFARRAARVVLVARNVEHLEAVRREIEPYTSDVLVVPADITQEDQLQAVVTQTLDAFGRIDVLVNNAGALLGGRLQDQDAGRIEQLIRLNLWAPIRLTQLVVPHMLAENAGYILNIGSGLGRTAAPLLTIYTASKYGLLGFSNALRRELDGTGIYLTLVLPTWTHTDMLPGDVEDTLEKYGYRLEHPDAVAERALLALVHGDNEVIIGGPMIKLGVWLERFVPFVMRIYWRFVVTPEWTAAMNKLGPQ